MQRFAAYALMALCCLPLAAESSKSEPQQDRAAAPERSAFYMEGRWLAKEGGFLPFKTDREVLEFLATAPIVDSEVITGTSSNPLKLTLEKDGVRARAVFRTVHVERDQLRSEMQHARGFRDHYVYEVAAYELSRLLGLDNVPPATLRTVDGQEGSIQLWIEKAMGVAERMDEGIDETHQQLWLYQKQNMAVFDNLIYNFDRNPGNMLLDARGKAWFVDHTRTFKILPALNGRKDIKVLERQVWKNLCNLDSAVVQERLDPYLRQTEIDALLKRRDKLVKFVEKRLQKHGEQAILFEFVKS